MKIGVLGFILLITACSPQDGTQTVIEDLARNRSIDIQVWLPDAEVYDPPYPLVLLSHGSGGEYINHLWLVDALADEGYMVAAPNHPLDTTRDSNDVGIISVWQRPADMSRLLDWLLEESQWSSLIDSSRIGAAGFSSGGYTVLAMAGAQYDPALMDAYCSAEIHGPDCDLVGDMPPLDYTEAAKSYKDTRIKSIFAMAPAVGPAITTQSLEAVDLPVYITAAQDDELVYPQYGATRYAADIPGSTLELLPAGGHFIFLECNFVTSIADYFVDFDLCGTQFDVEQEPIREQVASRAVQFFDNTMSADSIK